MTDDLTALIAEALRVTASERWGREHPLRPNVPAGIDVHRVDAITILASPAGQRIAAMEALVQGDPSMAVYWQSFTAQQEARHIAEAERAAARADAERLAEALRRAHRVVQMMQTGYRLDARDAAALVGAEDQALAALALHDEQEPTKEGD
jgi:hypothetical protein